MKIINNKIWLYQGETAAPTCTMYTEDGEPLVFASTGNGQPLSYSFAFTVKEDKFTNDITFQLTGNMSLKTFADTTIVRYNGALEKDQQGQYVVPYGLQEGILYCDQNKIHFYIENDAVNIYDSSITINLPYEITHNLDAKRYYYEIVVYGKYAGSDEIATKTIVVEPLDFTIIGSLSK